MCWIWIYPKGAVERSTGHFFVTITLISVNLSFIYLLFDLSFRGLGDFSVKLYRVSLTAVDLF